MTYFLHILPNFSSFTVVLLFAVIEPVFLKNSCVIKKTTSMSGTGENFLFVSSALEICTYLFTAWLRVVLEKLIRSQIVKKYPYFMEPKSLIPHLKVPAVYRSSEADRFSPCPHSHFLEDPS